MTILGKIAVAHSFFVTEKCQDGLFKTLQSPLTTRFPIGTLKQDDKIIAPNMADKISLAVAHLGKNFPCELNHFVTAIVAKDIIERLEMIQIAITGAEFCAFL